MLQSALIALREWVEAALVVGIVLVYLDRTGRARLARAAWAGLAAAVSSSLGVAVALERWQVSQEGFEGALMLLAAAFVTTMVVWMSRVARHLKQRIEQRVEEYAGRAAGAAGWGVGTFVFLMVLREGVELALILRAVELSSDGLNTWLGTAVGLSVAVAVGVFFFKGTLRIPLARFFSATSVILMIVAAQLALTGVHELSEARWLPSSRQEMALVGPIVRHDVFFFVVILGAAALLVLREWARVLKLRDAPDADVPPAARRLAEWNARRDRRWMFAAGFTCLAVILMLTADFLYARALAAPPDARTLAPADGRVRVPLDELADGRAHFYSVELSGGAVRLLAIRKPGGMYAAALDACQICGPAGYAQEGGNLICRNCAAAIYIPSVGDTGGCNPIGVPSRVVGDALAIALADLAPAASHSHH